MNELLNKAADLIEERGWNQGDYRSPVGALCAIGAIITANDEARGIHPETIEFNLWSTPVREAVETLAKQLDQEPLVPPYVMNWNDTPGRTATEVVSMLRKAALR